MRRWEELLPYELIPTGLRRDQSAYRFVFSVNWLRRVMAKIPTNAMTVGANKRYIEMLLGRRAECGRSFTFLA